MASDRDIEITVNGQPRRIPEGSSVAALLIALGIERGRVAVERNLEVVPRATYDHVVLGEGDKLEVVTFVGGG